MLVFGYGVAVGRHEIFPFTLIKFAQDSIHEVFEERETIAHLRPTEHLFKAREDGEGAIRVDEKQRAPGLTLLSGFFDQGLELRLMQSDGSVVNQWPVRFYSIFEDTSHISPKQVIPQSNWHTEIHGVMVFPDGSLLFNFETKGLVRMDRCGAVLWKLARMTHHSVDMAQDGGFWVPGLRYHDVKSTSPFPALAPPYKEDLILKVSPEGKVLQEISIVGLLLENNFAAYLFANGPDGTGLASWDPTHLNDIKEISPEMAPHFKQFAAGDLLISLRNLNMILVIDPATRRIKWHRTGPWMDQHDPELMPGGKISVFSNNNDRTELGTKLGGSTIIEADVNSGETLVRYGGRPHQRMYTKYKGRHQNLDNGNTLIVESRAGRVIEVNPAGDIVWKYINRYDTDNIALINDAARYPPGYFKVTDWSCPKR
jgi:hypothetical protein